MAVFVVLWPYLLITKLRCLQKNNTGHTKTGGGGFGGSGFKFDESEAAYTSEKKKFQKTVFGLQDSDDEDVEGEIDDQIEVRFFFAKLKYGI